MHRPEATPCTLGLSLSLHSLSARYRVAAASTVDTELLSIELPADARAGMIVRFTLPDGRIDCTSERAGLVDSPQLATGAHTPCACAIDSAPSTELQQQLASATALGLHPTVIIEAISSRSPIRRASERVRQSPQ